GARFARTNSPRSLLKRSAPVSRREAGPYGKGNPFDPFTTPAIESVGDAASCAREGKAGAETAQREGGAVRRTTRVSPPEAKRAPESEAQPARARRAHRAAGR